MSAKIIESEKEKEKPKPEAVAVEAIKATELRDGLEPDDSFGLAYKVKDYLKKSATGFFGWEANKKYIMKDLPLQIKTGVYFELGFAKNILSAAYNFAAVAIEKKGNIGFKDGYKIGKNMFNFDKTEKDKK